jgi:hypothetical protein
LWTKGGSGALTIDQDLLIVNMGGALVRYDLDGNFLGSAQSVIGGLLTLADNRWVAVGSDRISVFDRNTLNPTQSFVYQPSTIAFSSANLALNGSVFLSPYLYRINLGNGQLQSIPPLNTNKLASDGQSLFVLQSGAISVRTPTGALQYSLESPNEDIRDFILTTTHLFATVGRSDDALSTAVFDLDSRTRIHTLPTGGTMAYAADTLFVGETSGRLTAYSFTPPIFSNGFE